MFKSMAKSIGAGLRAVGRAAPDAVVDVAGLGGVGAIAYGAWMVYPPAGFIVGGTLVVAGAVVLGAKASRRGN